MHALNVHGADQVCRKDEATFQNRYDEKVAADYAGDLFGQRRDARGDLIGIEKDADLCRRF